MIDLQRLMETARMLHPLPVSASRLASLLARADCNMDEVVEVAELDQALTARLLRTANSAASAAVSPVRTVREALIRLGASTVLAIAVGVAVREQMKMALPEYGLSEEALWRHSVAAALATEAIGPHVRAPIPPEAFAAALLHDVGKLVVGRCALNSPLQESIERGGTGCLSKLESELALLQTHHAALGGLVAQHWRLPKSMVKGILFHHEPGVGAETICDIVCLANQVAHASMAASDELPPMTLEDHRCRTRMEMSTVGFTQSCQVVRDRLEEVMARFE